VQKFHYNYLQKKKTKKETRKKIYRKYYDKIKTKTELDRLGKIFRNLKN